METYMGWYRIVYIYIHICIYIYISLCEANLCCGPGWAGLGPAHGRDLLDKKMLREACLCTLYFIGFDRISEELTGNIHII